VFAWRPSFHSFRAVFLTMPPPRPWGEAFDAACKALHDRGQPTVVYEVMARIIAAARKGESDVWRLRCAALQALAERTER
jgi:hypothetical protein